MRLLVPCFAAALVTGCFSAPGTEGYCERDADCAGQCARGNVCIDEGSGKELRLRWTIDGVAPSPASPEPCAGLDGLEITFLGGAEDLSYWPVSCELGTIYYDLLPPWIDRVVVTALDPTGIARAQVARELSSSGDITVDLAP